MKLLVGNHAPEFSAPDQNGKIHTLADYKGKWVLLYFYPKDFTSGCTVEACSIRDNFKELSKLVTVLGVSADSVASHKKFIAKHELPFTLLADPERKVINAYGTNGIIFTKRTSFLIDARGIIAKIYEKVNPATHVSEILSDLKTKLI
ncbi:peroxiredoxin [Candidatus Gottesmanbacteria bacterium]|nr:peroxiredoxin [Candidatus Gottesmanbacteria bacterium]